MAGEDIETGKQRGMMLLKVALVLAVGSLGVMLMRHPGGSQEEAAALEREITAQLQALREYLFAR